ncbi:PAS domain S-box protein [Desulfobulbus elongatus]|uniref:PAS domain S-box protein n=1 Tax=Desulfobulbus elongatus TaxID=53332 RepID=UPI0006883638|nr:PAS domain S-box protein [Desulfobulbus elongatus]
MNRTELEIMQARYFDLYELAPVGYLTLSAAGLILEANRTALALLGARRETLLRQPFSRFIAAADRTLVLPECGNDVGENSPQEPCQCELRMVRPDGSVFWAHLAITTLQQIDDLTVRRVVLSDITDRKQVEEALRESEERHRLLFEAAPDALLLVDAATSRIVKANGRAAELYGYMPDELSGKRYGDFAVEPGEIGAEGLSDEAGRIHVPTGAHRKRDGAVFPVEVIGRSIPLSGQPVVCLTVRDITRRTQTEAIMTARLRLLRSASEHSLAELLQTTLAEAETLTGSTTGFYHLLGADQLTLSLQAWSAGTRHLCRAEGAGLHYPVGEAGVWTDCIRERRTVIHNDYASLPHRRGLPPGHVPVVRELVVPVMRGGAVVALLGVGNKPTEYNEQDVEAVTALADLAWDIAERKRAEEALRASEERRFCEQAAANAQLREQTESLASIYHVLDSVGLIVCDLVAGDARIAIFNSGAEKLFGWQQEEAVGRSIALIYPPEVAGLIPARVERFAQGKAMQSFDMILVRRSGERFPAVVSVHPFGCREGRFRKVVGVFRDIAELKRAQMELEAINEDLERRVEQRTKELQETQKQYLHAEKLSAIGKLSASIAHEFNNPLQGILSILKGLRKRAILDEEDRALLDAAIGESDRIKELIRGLHEFNRPSSGRKVPVDVHNALDSVLLLHKSDFRHKRIAVERAYAERLPRILAVPDQIKQVFLNLLANAADACQRHGGVITVRTREEGDRVVVAIADTGIGIDAGEMALIFQPFYTTKPEVKGTGLGLSVSYGIVNNHGGEIRVASTPGQGATFTVVLPIRGDDACEGATEPWPPPGIPSAEKPPQPGD